MFEFHGFGCKIIKLIWECWHTKYCKKLRTWSNDLKKCATNSATNINRVLEFLGKFGKKKFSAKLNKIFILYVILINRIGEDSQFN